MMAGTGCTVGCTGHSAHGEVEKAQHCSCEWYNNNTMLPTGVPSTIARDSPLRTYMDWSFYGSPPLDIYERHPWRAPGSAPIFSPCGVDGGNPKGCGSGNDDPCAPGGYPFGPDAIDFPFPDVVTTEWTAGSVVEVAWGITANHGGGYSYRLCPRKSTGMNNGDLTEECFQKMPLSFVGDRQWAQFGTNRSARVEFPAMRTSNGTSPLGSMWTRNPIPACAGPGGTTPAGFGGGGASKGYKPCSVDSFKGGEWEGIANGTQFPPPLGYPSTLPDDLYLYGFGNNGAEGGGTFEFNIVDLLQVPSDIRVGDYVLSFRYDCEQTAQVWSTCGNIRILSNTSDIIV